MKKDKIKVYIYTRVSTTIQVDGYSLDAQKARMKAFAEYNDYKIVGEYEDAGKSGKSIEGRLEFNRMMEDIKSGKDGVSYVLVFKLSRFGRNAADVLSTLQVMQDFGVNLICVEDGIDSSKDAGKLMISVLSAVAEIERENIRVQTILIPACGVGAPHKRYRVWFIASDRSDARIEGLRQKRKDKVHGCLVATDTYGEKLQKWLKNNGREIEEENIARLDNGVERSCCIRAFADSDNERLSTIGITDRISSEEREKKRRCLMQYTSNDWPALSAERWKDFPTQPPVCRRNDGLPFDVDYLAISFTKWRQESIKAYGNAIVPQVAFEIFKAIETSTFHHS